MLVIPNVQVRNGHREMELFVQGPQTTTEEMGSSPTVWLKALLLTHWRPCLSTTNIPQTPSLLLPGDSSLCPRSQEISPTVSPPAQLFPVDAGAHWDGDPPVSNNIRMNMAGQGQFPRECRGKVKREDKNLTTMDC